MNNAVYSMHYFWFMIIKMDTVLKLVMGLPDLFCVNTLASSSLLVCALNFRNHSLNHHRHIVLFCTWQCFNCNCFTRVVSVMPSYMFDIIYESILLLFERCWFFVLNLKKKMKSRAFLWLMLFELCYRVSTND